MENVFLGYVLWYVAIIWTLAGFIRILYPNWALKKYISKQWEMPRENLTRFGGIITLGLGLYVIAVLLE